MQGRPYDTASGGCNNLEGGITILDIGVHCLQSNIDFSQLLTKPLMFFSYIGHTVSIQQSSGAILGCGRFESHFPVYASYRGQIVIQQYSRYHLTALAGMTTPIFETILNIVLESIDDTCPSKSSVFDPWKPPPKQVGSKKTTDRFPVGDLVNRLRELNYYFLDVPLIGSATILGHTVCTDHNNENDIIVAVIA